MKIIFDDFTFISITTLFVCIYFLGIHASFILYPLFVPFYFLSILVFKDYSTFKITKILFSILCIWLCLNVLAYLNKTQVYENPSHYSQKNIN